jgi:phosphoribosylglycinamide formyltransferase 2
VILVDGESDKVSFENVDKALQDVDTQIRLFGKPGVSGRRRMGVALARGSSIEEAREKARSAAAAVTVKL